MMRLLLHACCAPCLAAAAEKLKNSFEVTAFFYNPNIHPEEEYSLRLREARRYALRESVKILEGSCEPEKWFENVKGMGDEKEGGARCEACFRMRIEKTAQTAESLGIKNIASTLTAGPGKKAVIINSIGEETAGKYGLTFLSEDFKKKDGFKKAIKICREHGIYRQNYCGCVFSRKNKICAE